jgi:hypothetical protein
VSVAARCEQCGTAFDPLSGGICAACGRLLCGRHLRGWLASLLPPLGSDAPRCPDCRRSDRPVQQRTVRTWVDDPSDDDVPQ